MNSVHPLHLAPAPRTNPLGGASATPPMGVAPCTDWPSRPSMKTELLSIKELAFALKRHRNHVSEMKRAGFPMPGNRVTLTEARTWLAENPGWRTRLPARSPYPAV